MEITIIDQQEDVDLDLRALETVVELVLEAEMVSCDELSVFFVSEEQIAQLHAEHFDDPTPTDCITFPMDSPHSGELSDESAYVYLGDVFICPAVAVQRVEELEVDFAEELTLYLVHTLLHLCGYTDTDEASIDEMRDAERRHLNLLKSVNALLSINHSKGELADL